MKIARLLNDVQENGQNEEQDIVIKKINTKKRLIEPKDEPLCANPTNKISKDEKRKLLKKEKKNLLKEDKDNTNDYIKTFCYAFSPKATQQLRSAEQTLLKKIFTIYCGYSK